MSIKFFADDPSDLLSKFKSAVSGKGACGSITTWEQVTVTCGGKKFSVFTHKKDEWKNKAFIRPWVYDGILGFNIVSTEEYYIDDECYSYYNGHLLETFIRHFDLYFTSCMVSALRVLNTDGVTVALTN